jgi:hypothetical protein
VLFKLNNYKMKYLTITLLFVISLTNSEVLLQFRQNFYKFGDVKVEIGEQDSETVQTTIVEEGEEEEENYNFKKEGLVEKLEKHPCIALTDTAGNKIFWVDLTQSECDEGYVNVEHNVENRNRVSFKYCCLKQFIYVLDSDGELSKIGIKCNIFLKLAHDNPKDSLLFRQIDGFGVGIYLKTVRNDKFCPSGFKKYHSQDLNDKHRGREFCAKLNSHNSIIESNPHQQRKFYLNKSFYCEIECFERRNSFSQL